MNKKKIITNSNTRCKISDKLFGYWGGCEYELRKLIVKYLNERNLPIFIAEGAVRDLPKENITCDINKIPSNLKKIGQLRKE